MGTDFVSQIIEYKQHLISKQKQYRSESSLRNDAEKCLSRRPFIKPMENSKTEMKQLFNKLKHTIPTRSKGIYLSEGLYLMENGEVLEESML